MGGQVEGDAFLHGECGVGRHDKVFMQRVGGGGLEQGGVSGQRAADHGLAGGSEGGGNGCGSGHGGGDDRLGIGAGDAGPLRETEAWRRFGGQDKRDVGKEAQRSGVDGDSVDEDAAGLRGEDGEC